jgi:hypothetical protein
MGIDLVEAQRRGLSQVQAEDHEENRHARGQGFDEFWAIYPKKVARKDAMRAWDRMSTEQRFAALQSIPVHARYWLAGGTTRQYLPHAATWLNGERWTDELEMPEAPETERWWTTSSGIEAKARQLGVTPRPGEGHHELKARLLAKMKVAA